MNKIPIVKGDRYGRLTVINEAVRHFSGLRSAHCKCNCGNELDVVIYDLRSGNTVSCGCYQKQATSEKTSAKNITHGMSNSPEFSAWTSMKGRCLNPSHAAYQNYGGRGISICSEWSASFEAFYRDMGVRPEGASLDRKDNSGSYSKGNCRWATVLEQNNNQRTNRLISMNGITMTVSQWARCANLTHATLTGRLNRWGNEMKSITTVGRGQQGPSMVFT